MAINENSETMIFFLLLKVVVIVVATCTQTTTIWHYGFERVDSWVTVHDVAGNT